VVLSNRDKAIPTRPIGVQKGGLMQKRVVLRGFLVFFFVFVLSFSLPAQKTSGSGEFDTQKLTDAEIGTIGKYWLVTEPYGWSGAWVRRLNTPSQAIYDATWKHTNGTVVTDVIHVQSWNSSTKQITFYRVGNGGKYSGVIDLNRLVLENGTASWYPAGVTWSAKISNAYLANTNFDDKGKVIIR